MTAWIVIGVIVLLIVLLMLLRVGVRAIYDADGFILYLRVGLLHFRIIPQKKKQPTLKEQEKKRKKEEKKKKKRAEQKKKQAEKKAKGSEKKPEEKKKPGDFLWLLQLVRPALHALAQLPKKLRIHRLWVSYAIPGAEDPAKASIRYGQISAGGGALFPLINAAFDVRDWDVDLFVDYLAEKTMIALEAEASYRIGQLFAIVFALGFKALAVFLKHLIQSRKQKKSPDRGGKQHGRKASDR